jgi:hypothetical protein
LALPLLAVIAIWGVFSATAVGMRNARNGKTAFILSVIFSSIAFLLTVFESSVSTYLASNSTLTFDQIQYFLLGLAGVCYIIAWALRM